MAGLGSLLMPPQAVLKTEGGNTVFLREVWWIAARNQKILSWWKKPSIWMAPETEVWQREPGRVLEAAACHPLFLHTDTPFWLSTHMLISFHSWAALSVWQISSIITCFWHLGCSQCWLTFGEWINRGELQKAGETSLLGQITEWTAQVSNISREIVPSINRSCNPLSPSA